jgi:hypothetical protein
MACTNCCAGGDHPQIYLGPRLPRCPNSPLTVWEEVVHSERELASVAVEFQSTMKTSPAEGQQHLGPGESQQAAAIHS